MNPEDVMLSPEQVAKLWNVHRTTIMRIFHDEPGVMKISSKSERARKKTIMRIPIPVLERVRRRNEVV